MTDVGVPVTIGRRRGAGRLELEAKLFQRSVWPFAQTIARGDTLAGPLVVELDPTSFCDMACPECISAELLNQGRFSRDRLKGLAGELIAVGVQAVILIGGGEPLLHNGVGEVIDRLGAAGVAIGLTTNGTMIHRHLDRIANHVAWTRVSVDAGSAECFERFRPHRSGRNVFDVVIDNMRRLAATKRGALGYSYLLVARTDADGGVLDSNFCDVATAAALARDIGCDYFEVKPTYDLGHFLLDQPAALAEALDQQLAEARALAGAGFEVISPQTLATVVGGEATVEPKNYHRCPIAELRTLVTSTGAYICPYHRGNPDACYGDPVTQPFDELWASARRREVQTRVDPSTDCRFHCIRHESNLTLLAMGGEDLSHKVTEDYDRFI